VPRANPDPLVRLRRRGGDITDDHVAAAAALRATWEKAKEGDGPARAELARVLSALGRSCWPLLHWVVVLNGDVAGWVRSRREAGETLDPAKVLGGLLFILGRLVEAAPGVSQGANRGGRQKNGL